MWMAGLEPWDVTMSDLLTGSTSLDSFQGAVTKLPCAQPPYVRL